MSSLALSKVTPQEFRYQLAHWDDNRGYVVTAVTTTFYALAFVFVVLRFLAIRKIGRKLKIEDYTIAGALVGSDIHTVALRCSFMFSSLQLDYGPYPYYVYSPWHRSVQNTY